MNRVSVETIDENERLLVAIYSGEVLQAQADLDIVSALKLAREIIGLLIELEDTWLI